MDLAFITLAIAATAFIHDPVFGSKTGILLGRDVVWSNRMGSFDRTERAAFIVDAGDGRLNCVAWPPTYERERATFTGSVPPGTIAIVHTHPRNVPWPSNHDRAEARRLGIPIYVMTPQMVTKAVPSGGEPVLVHSGTWLDPPPPHACKRVNDRN